MKVLLIDNDPMLLKALSRLLGDAGHEPIPVNSYEDAKRALLDESLAFDAVLSDYDLGSPTGDGTDLLHLAMHVRPGIPHILMSGQTVAFEGAHFLPKPFSKASLLRAMGCE